ncbi:MAG TPA: hypothetical protein VFL93_01900 [Longimicrobiaceae bacterium]|nr:hypothetical protein [Longimicrobiaceae bacterium]
MRRIGPWALALVLLCAPVAAAQQVRVAGAARGAAADSLRAILARNDYLLLRRDTVLGDSVHLTGDLVVDRATVRLSGRVDGSVAVVEGMFFLRPGARVGGSIVSTPGSLFLPSARATFGDSLTVPLSVRASIERTDSGEVVRLTPPPGPRAITPGGLFGLGLPTYDRVDGVTPRLSVRFQPFGARESHLNAEAWVGYHSARGTLAGGGRITLPIGGDYRASIEFARATLTNEEWIRGDLVNSLAALFFRSDARDYRESDYVSATFERLPSALRVGHAFVAPRLTLLASRDHSLDARDPWTVFHGGEDWRPNPWIADGDLVSATLGARLGWRGTLARFAGDAALEWAPGTLSDFSFAQLAAHADWQMAVIRGQFLTVRGHLLQPIGPDGAPPQRWSFVGGPGTLPTLDYDGRRGDHLVFVESTYAFPIPWVTVPLLGPPTIALRDAVGSAWVTDGPTPRWEQSAGVGAQFRALEAFLYIDPADPGAKPAFVVAVALPR